MIVKANSALETRRNIRNNNRHREIARNEPFPSVHYFKNQKQIFMGKESFWSELIDYMNGLFTACFLAGNVCLNVGFFQRLATNAKLQVSTTKR